MKIDDLDKKLLALLTKDGRMSSSQLARIVGASERTVVNRVNKLVQNDIISITGKIKRDYFGYDVMADIFCKVESTNLNEIARKIAEFPEVSYVAISFGEQDISLQVVAKSPAELYDFVTNRLLRLPGIERTNTVVVPTVVKDFNEWLPPELKMVRDQLDAVQEAKNLKQDNDKD
jgi:DNA-binding Lrp family transcriptional regulator